MKILFKLEPIVPSILYPPIDNKEGKVVLKKNCKIGAHSLIMPGVTIGENSIIGAFSFVNRNIPKNTLAFGIPVRLIKKLSKKELKKYE